MNGAIKFLMTTAASGLVAISIAGAALAAAETPEKTKDPSQFARGAQAWAETCNRCHSLRSPRELTDEIWEISVTHMRVRGNLPAAKARDIKAFLKASNN